MDVKGNDAAAAKAAAQKGKGCARGKGGDKGDKGKGGKGKIEVGGPSPETIRLKTLFEAMAVCDELGIEVMAQARALAIIVNPEEHDVKEVRRALAEMDAKRTKGILFAFIAVGKHLVRWARETLAETSADQALQDAVAQVQDLTVALLSMSPSTQWLESAKRTADNLDQIARSGSRSLRHRIQGEVCKALDAVHKGTAQLLAYYERVLLTDIAQRLCPIFISEKDYGGLVGHRVPRCQVWTHRWGVW